VTKLNILLPLYNDWRSCNYLIKKINDQLSQRKRYADILILNDASTQKTNINKKGIKNIGKIKVLTSNKNLGSQKIITLGLNFVKKEKNKINIIMDSDGEDDVLSLNNLIDICLQNSNYIAVAARVKRRENLIFRILYKSHLILTFLLTLKWISFGNYSCFYSKQISNILKNNESWLAFSSSVAKNCKLIKLDTDRQKRFFGKSKLSFYGLFNHAFRILAVFQKRVFLISSFYVFLLIIIYQLTYTSLFLGICFFILIINFLIILTKNKTLKDINNIYFKEIKSN
tara:strand:+ start:91 stop:945 length:855 start_codon:yes stop_codon:yes gene_type:complete